MTKPVTTLLSYPLHNGYVHNWLVAGPITRALSQDEPRRLKGDLSDLTQCHRGDLPAINQTPVERDMLGDTRLSWRPYHCLEDHFVDLSAGASMPSYLCHWAYAQVNIPLQSAAGMQLTLNSAATVWLNGEVVHECRDGHVGRPGSIHIPVVLQAGVNEILLRLDTLAAGECAQLMALSLDAEEHAGWTVQLPTRIEAVKRRMALDRLYRHAYLDRDVFSSKDKLTVYWPDDLSGPDALANVELRVETLGGQTHMMAYTMAQANSVVDLGPALRLPDGECRLWVMPEPEEYALKGMRIRHEIRLFASKNAYSETRYGTYTERRVEALLDAARRQQDIFAELAKMALGRWDVVKEATVQAAIDQVTQRWVHCSRSLLALLAMVQRFAEDPAFPTALKKALLPALTGFDYRLDVLAMREQNDDLESEQILTSTCELLAGQLYPDTVFGVSGCTGQWHAEQGAAKAAVWLRERGQVGFADWHSNMSAEVVVAALAQLVDLADDETVRELAAVLLDKLAFSLALNSFQGVYGAAKGRSDSMTIRNGRLDPASGISRLLWGRGVFNEHIMGSVSLACADHYLLPPLIEAVAEDVPDALWNRQRHESVTVVDTVSYRTADYLLASAQDYRPGEAGISEHLWQATLGPDAIVFVNHPANMSQSEAQQPNFWRGNHRLPRVAQWKDALVAVYSAAEDDWLEFTHAYFPVYAFDAYTLRDGWAFAQKGEGYLALTASQPFTLLDRGPGALRELRAEGLPVVWLCQMGRAGQDGSFENFQERVLALPVDFDGLSLSCTTLRGDRLDFGWEGPLRLNQHAQAITGFKHFENLYCTAEVGAAYIEIQHGYDAMRLHFD